MTTTTTATALRALLESLIDYAGLFPPAGLDMRTAVENYLRYKDGPYAWMLGRFVVPVARLQEFESAWASAGEPSGWKLSALVANAEADLATVQEFNATYAGDIEIDAIELKAAGTAEIHAVPRLTGYVEVPIANDPMALLVQIKREKCRAKVRTGGVSAEMFPEAAALVRFLRSCAGASVPFKATAGLHHPLHCTKPYTYAPDSPRGAMHGFLNVFLAAAFARKGYAARFLEQLLMEEKPTAFTFSDSAFDWRDARLSAKEIAEARANFAIAFGSCSFEEPIADLQALGLLPG
jgi:hypothetical protein